MRSSFAIARLKAVDRGVHLGAYAPWGYRRNNAGRLRPDPRTGTMVTELFRMRAAGRPLAEIARWVQAQGVLTGSGNSTWTASSVHSITRNPVYLGEVRCNEHVRAGAHAPLTDPVTWQAAQHRVALRDSFTGGEGRLLSGLVRCSACCMTMAFRRTPTASVYGCRGKSSKGRCPARGLIRAELLEAYVESIVFELLRRRRRLGVAAEHQATEALAAADAALVRYRDNEAIARVLGEDRFVAGLAVRTDRVRTARLKLATIRESAAMHTLPRAGEIEANWSTMSVRQRRDIIRSVIDCVFIARGTRAQGAPERVWLCPVGTAPRFPHTRNGYRLRNGPRPFSPTRSTVRPKTAYRLFRWPHKRIDRELRHFTRGRATWPTEAEFCDADRRTLYWQIRLGAGERTWAHHLHLTIFRYGVLEEPWTDDRTRAALRLYLSDHPIRPSPHQLAINDLFSLRTGMARTGGQAKWVQELGLPDAWA
jgi:hypothetical protein